MKIDTKIVILPVLAGALFGSGWWAGQRAADTQAALDAAAVEAPAEAGSRSIKPPAEFGTRDYVAVVDRVVDGDTVDLKVRMWSNLVLEDRFRLFGINAPETRGEERPEGLKSTEWLTAKLEPHATITVRVEPKRGKYGRWLAVLLVPGEDGELVDLNKLMVAEGFAKEANY